MSVLVEDNPAQQRFEILVDGGVVGFAAYDLRPGVVVFTHTEVDPAFRGKGISGALARAALEQVRERGERVVASCEFIAAYIDKHPQYAELLLPA